MPAPRTEINPSFHTTIVIDPAKIIFEDIDKDIKKWLSGRYTGIGAALRDVCHKRGISGNEYRNVLAKTTEYFVGEAKPLPHIGKALRVLTSIPRDVNVIAFSDTDNIDIAAAWQKKCRHILGLGRVTFESCLAYESKYELLHILKANSEYANIISVETSLNGVKLAREEGALPVLISTNNETRLLSRQFGAMYHDDLLNFANYVQNTISQHNNALNLR